MKKLVVGCGYLGQRVAAAWRIQGDCVYVLTRSAERADSLRQLGFKAIVGDVTDPNSLTELSRLPGIATTLYAVGHDRESGNSIRKVYVNGLRNVLEALPANTERLIYISSTGVYGQSDNETVDETSECMPTREGGRACWEAEQTLAHHTFGSKSVILRLAGIYGLGRIPSLTKLQSGQTLNVNADAYLNLIHVDDACRIVLSAEQATTPNLFVVSDGVPVRRREFYEHAAKLIGTSVTFGHAEDNDSGRRAQSGGKRICADKLRRELDFVLQYPNYREGLAEILAES
ncbi:MAG: SDR family oxidoreductase [Planctomycetales bacterium]|nr:SDR family oxidoreductase [Planctomycetales bacterium]